MGAFDDLESQPSTKYTSMLGLRVGVARRRIVLIGLLTCFLILTLVAFRRQDTIKDVVNSSQHRNNSTATAAVEKPHKAQSKANSTAENESILDKVTGSDETDSTSNSRLQSDPPKQLKGPKLDNGDRTLAPKSLADLHNRTLGFGNVFVLNMPARSDKLDAMKLTASLTDFEFTVIPGINGKDVPNKALSGVWKDYPGVGGVIGCWRGHMEFAGEVVKQNVATALVMEDDADWDVSFRTQLEYIALGAQTLQNSPKDSTPHSPYGDDWDLIWLGHCASQPVKGDDRRFYMKNDPNVTPFLHRTNFGGIPDMTPYDNTTRMMYWSSGSTCTYSYALSLHGARKTIKWLSMDTYSGPIDYGLHDMCEKKERGFKCIGVFPQIIADHKPAGVANKDTNIAVGGDDIRQKGFSLNIVHSTRMNVDHLIDGKIDEVESQWPQDNPHLKGPIITEYTAEPNEESYSK